MNDSASIQNSFDTVGFVRCAGFLDADEIRGAIESLDRFIEGTLASLPREHVFYDDKNDAGSLKQIQQLHTYDPAFEALMIDSKAQRLAECVLRGPVVPKNMQYFNKAAGIGQPTPAHQDGFYFKLDPCEAVTLWLALDDVDEENGCVHYARASHLNGVLPHNTTSTLGFSQGITDPESYVGGENDIPCLASPGDLLAHHALTIHWAGGNTSPTRSRRALGFIYYSANAREDVEAQEAYQRELAAKLTESGKL
jgi:phytanoyl-CoA hydroxylase